MKSKFLNLHLNDFVKGLITSIIFAILTSIQDFLTNGGSISSIEWKTVLNVAILTFISYLIKNWLTNSKDKFLKKENT